MKFGLSEQTPAGRRRERGSARGLWILGGACGVVILFALLRGGGSRTTLGSAGDAGGSTTADGGSSVAGGFRERRRPRLVSEVSGGGGGANPAAVVADKVAQFSRNRRQVLETLAQRLNLAIPPEVDGFFSAVESGDWRDIKTIYNSVSAMVSGKDAPPGMASLWPAIRDTYAVAEAKEVWPPDQLLAFGQSVLASVDSGMTFVGMSQWGRSIPALLNETSGDGRAVILDHAMLSEPGYTEYLGVMYGDRLKTPTQEDAQRAREAYLAELAERARNNQLRPGETVPSGDQRTFVPGSVGATEVAEKMLMAFLEQNPGMSVAVEKPTPGSPLYEWATPMGPVFEVKAPGAGNAAPGVAAEQAVQYWKDAVGRLQSVPVTDESVVTRRSFAEMATAQANLMASHSRTAEAEQTYRSAIEIAPMALEPVSAIVNFLHGAGRGTEAQQIVEDFARRNPEMTSQAEFLRARLAQPRP